VAVAQNGWTASPDKAAIGVVPFVVAGVSFPGGVKSGPVATVLGYVALQFHSRVEALRSGECWGYNYREISGSDTISNHGAGCAIDINAPRHPLGKLGTFTKEQVAQIRAILRETGGVVRWGGAFFRPDEMHWEIVGNSAQVKRVADGLVAKSLLTGNAIPSTTVTKGVDVTHIPVAVTPERTFRAAFMCEAGAESAVVERAWITIASTWGNSTMTVTALAADGKVLLHREDVVVRNNHKVTVDVPSGTAIATVEGMVEHPTTLPVVGLVAKARA
jgi:hypothetical protein